MSSHETGRDFWREHKWEIILGLVFAVLFGVAWEGFKVLTERADRVPPERLASGTVRIFMVIDLKNDPQRQAVAAWQKEHFAIAAKDFAIVKMGSGFAATDDGWVVTAAHILDTTRLAPLLAATGARPYVKVAYPPDIEPVVVGQPIVDAAADVAIVKVDRPPENRFLVLGESEEAHLTDRVTAIGYPEAGDSYEVLAPTVISGEISKVGSDAKLGTILQSTVNAGPGSSGGPIVDAESRVIGFVREISRVTRGFTFCVGIDHAREMLKKQKVRLPSHYERQGLLRQPATLWTALVLGLVLFLGYFGNVLRPIWARLFGRPQTTAGRFAIGVTALLIDFAVVAALCIGTVVVLIRITGWFLPWYYGVVATLPLLLLYALVYRRRTIGARVANNAAASRWRLFGAAVAAIALLLFAGFGHLGYLYDHAVYDVEHGTGMLWSGSDPATALRISRDRMKWFSILHTSPGDQILYDYGLTLMAANAPREAIRAFAAAAGDTWEALRTPGRTISSVVDDAAAKTGWCDIDLGDYAAARRMFAYVLRGYDRHEDALLGLAVACMRSGDAGGMRDAYAKLVEFHRGDVEKLLRGDPFTRFKYKLTPAQLRAVAQLQSISSRSQPAR